MSDSTQAVIVTTAHRGVFFGYLVGSPTREKVLLERARCCVHWSAETRGFVGLAARGPAAGSRVGPAAPSIVLYDVTSVVTCTPEAVERWERGPWS